MTRAVRSPGSTLKPLIYGLAFELGLAHPETLIEDRPIDFAGYAPANFDREFRGTVSVRRGAAAVAQRPGDRAAGGGRPGAARRAHEARRRDAGAARPLAARPRRRPRRRRRDADRPRRHPRRDRARRHGRAARRSTPTARSNLDGAGARCSTSAPPGTSPSSSPARRGPDHVSPGSIAFKTGTSYGYRDAWAIGFDGRHVDRRLGRPAGRRAGARPDRHRRRRADPDGRLRPHRRAATPLRAAPPGMLEATTAEPAAAAPPLPLAERAGGRARAESPEIAYPPRRARRSRHPRRRPDAAGPQGARTARRPTPGSSTARRSARASFGGAMSWQPTGPGFVDLMVIDAHGASATGHGVRRITLPAKTP